MLLAESDDVEARLRRSLTEDESSHIDDVLEEASVLVTEHCRGRDFGDDIPDAVRIVTSRVAARALTASTTPVGVQAVDQQAGAFRQTHTFTSDSAGGSFYLTAVDRKQLRRWARVGVVSFDTR